MSDSEKIINIYTSHCNISTNNLTDTPDGNVQNPDDVCTMCGKMFDDWDRQENFGFDYHVGYGSIHDGEILHARFCCDCFDKIIDQITPLCKTNPIVGEYF